MAIDIKNIADLLKKQVADAQLSNQIVDVGEVVFSGDGIIKVKGLTNVKYYEVLSIQNGASAIALNLEENEVGAVVLDDDGSICQGMTVKTTGRLMSVPVGDALLGRIVDPLGNPLDGKGNINTNKYREIEVPSASIMDRSPVSQPLQTGLISIDSMIPIGRGQRELIIGDRQTGKTAIAIDTIINQKDKNVICVYVAIGQKSSTVNDVAHKLEAYGALDYSIIVSATAKDSAPLQYIAPYSGCSMAEEFMYNGKDVLIVYDDLSKHAVAYRTLSLLLKRPAGREAYPGDIFYLHSRLLERSVKLCDALGGGSITALPIVETQAGDISAYIPTNVISITDGQIYLETELFNAGTRPAVNVGLSVSRVGGSAQIKAMRSVAGTLRLDLAQYRELAVFTQFGSDLDNVTKAVLTHGEKLTELLKQPQYRPIPVAKQVVMLYVISLPALVAISKKHITKYFEEFLKYVEETNPAVYADIDNTKLLSEENKKWLGEAAESFTKSFLEKI
ncbi:MAG: F0F1 ATP synthase subunit alpha [Clostridia bacterium]|nr:F0F1 ATP synthase subunit alpha [Clostridia bacterium]